MPPLSLRNIGKSFDGKPVLRDVSLDLTEGELFVLLGPSGCGKSTALRLIAGLEELDRGEIVLGDRRIDTLPPRERHVAMVFQNYALYPHMTVAKNLAFPLAVAGVPSDERRRRVQATVDMLGLGDRLNDRPAQLSGGQRQRVALGRAIIRQPELFLLDEPLSNLDADLRARMRLEIVKLQKQLCTTTVYVTHDQTEALTMADRVAVLNQGVLEQVGTPEELYREPATRFVAEFIGQPRINMLPAESAAAALARLGADTAGQSAVGVTEEPVFAGIRPEAIRIDPAGALAGRVEVCEYVGNEYILTVKTPGDSIRVSGCERGYDVGAMVRLRVPAAEVMFFDQGTGQRRGGR